MSASEKNSEKEQLISIVRILLGLVMFLTLMIVAMPLVILNQDRIEKFFTPEPMVAIEPQSTAALAQNSTKPEEVYWSPANDFSKVDSQVKSKLEYGKDLIAHTAKYLGPKGSVMKITNGLNCQNCHLDAGTKVFGNNYGSVSSTYPKFRARSGTKESVYNRVNDCIERSLNGKALDTTNVELQAMVAYIKFVGSNVEKGTKAKGSGLKDLAYLERAADEKNGKAVYEAKCLSCHQASGEGLLNADGREYTYPPLWGNNSYNDAAGLYRLSNFAKYVKYNMPQGTNHDNPQLTDDEAWDVAAYVNSQKRPHKPVPADWPDISTKPVDHPFGPFSDKYSKDQHKYGPFKPILESRLKDGKQAEKMK